MTNEKGVALVATIHQVSHHLCQLRIQRIAQGRIVVLAERQPYSSCKSTDLLRSSLRPLWPLLLCFPGGEAFEEETDEHPLH